MIKYNLDGRTLGTGGGGGGGAGGRTPTTSRAEPKNQTFKRHLKTNKNKN